MTSLSATSSELDLSELNFGEPINLSSSTDYSIYETVDVDEVLQKGPKEEERDLLKELYLGCLMAVEAEKKVQQPGALGLYHRHNGDIQLSVTLGIFIVYRASHGKCKHFALETVQKAGRELYRVEGLDSEQQFSSLSHLLRFYTTYVFCSEDKIDALPVNE